MARGIATIDHLRARSVVDPVTHCWHYQGALSAQGQPRIWTLDLERMDKTVLNGPRAVWFIAHGTPLGHMMAWMFCGTADCVCPVHVRRGTRAEWTRWMSAAGRMCRLPTPGRLAAAALGRAAAGLVDTPAEVVIAMREAYAAGEGKPPALAERFGVERSTAYRLLRGETYKHLLSNMAQAEALAKLRHRSTPSAQR